MTAVSRPKRMQSRAYLVISLFVVVALFSQTRVTNVRQDEHRLSLQSGRAKTRDVKSSHRNSLKKESESFSHSAWCPEAVCHDSELCHPCQRRFLIIIATGRSASTTLTYMMDSLPGVRMSGENKDTLGAIRHMISNIRDDRHFQRQQSEPKRGAWGHNPVPDGAFACVAQHMIETITPPILTDSLEYIEDDSDTIIGFKTIRFLDESRSSRYDSYLVQDIKDHFPCACILVNIRSNIQEQAASYAEKPAFRRRRGEVEHMNERMRRVADMFGSQAMLLDSSEWTKNIDSINQVVQWLGFHESCFFDKLLEFNTEGNGYGHGETEIDLHPNCRDGGEEMEEVSIT